MRTLDWTHWWTGTGEWRASCGCVTAAGVGAVVGGGGTLAQTFAHPSLWIVSHSLTHHTHDLRHRVQVSERLSLASEDRLEQAALKRSITSEIATLSDAYKYHCGHSLVADGGCLMRYSELRHLLDVCGALNTAREQSLLHRVFSKITSNKELAEGDPS